MHDKLTQSINFEFSFIMGKRSLKNNNSCHPLHCHVLNEGLLSPKEGGNNFIEVESLTTLLGAFQLPRNRRWLITDQLWTSLWKP